MIYGIMVTTISEPMKHLNKFILPKRNKNHLPIELNLKPFFFFLQFKRFVCLFVSSVLLIYNQSLTLHNF